MRGLSLVAASGGHSSLRCAGLSLSRPLLLQSTGSRRAGSVVVAHGPSCSAACGIFPAQGSNPCPLHWQADSQPLRHQGSPETFLKLVIWKQNINSTYIKYLEDKLQKQISYRVNKQLFLSHLIYSNYLQQRTNNLLGININTHRHIREETVI